MNLRIKVMENEAKKKKTIELNSIIQAEADNFKITDLGVAIEIITPTDKTEITQLKNNLTRILVWKT